MIRPLPVILAAGVLGLCALAGLSADPATQPLREDPPTASPPRPGDVSGVLKKAEKVTAVSAVSRATGKTYAPESFDPKTGRFLFKGLPGDAAYDVVAKTGDGRSIEGLDLNFVDARLLRLAAERRKELGQPPERSRLFTDEDAKALVDSVASMKEFFDIRRPIYIRGHGRRAVMLVELVRTRGYYGGDANWVSRIELWYYENNYGGWERVPNQERTLLRKDCKRDEWQKTDAEYYPALTAYVGPDGASAPVEFEIPEKPDPSTGRVAGTDPAIKTDPHILGLDKPASQPAD